jgi:dipeptidyl aminopeptidase/acylaminoacyl peptidase
VNTSSGRSISAETTLKKTETPPSPRRRSLLIGATLASTAPLGLAQAPLAPDAAKFFAREQTTGAVLSPDGKRLALRSIGSDGRAVLSVLWLETMQPKVVYLSDSADVGNFVWVNNERVAFDLTDATAPDADQDASPGLFAVDHDGERFRQLVERQIVWARAGSGTRRMQPWNTFLLNNTSQRQGNAVLVWRPESYDGKDIGHIKLLRLDTVTARVDEVEAPLHCTGWWADPDGQLRVVQTRQDGKGALRWRDPSTGTWKTLREFDIFLDDGSLSVRHVGADGRLYVAARRGSDRLSMWTVDPSTGEFSAAPLASSPQFDVDAHVVERRDRVLGLRFTIDAEVTQWLDADMKTLQQQIDKVLPRTANRLSVPWTGDEPWVLIEAFSDVQPKLYYLFNRATRKFTALGAQRPDINPKQQAGMDLQWLKARDGLALPTWVSMPRGGSGSSGKPLPTVVLIHGGPWVKNTSWRWDEEVQFLNALGYVVLQPQFRGTQGFGSGFETASWRQWGRSMQDDVTDATRWAITQGIADPGRIALMGASYGGYSTLMGLAREPALYRCGVAWVAVTDLDLMYGAHWSDFSDSYKQHGMPTRVGDRVKDAAELKANSPIHVAARIRQPLLLAHGDRDRRVPVEHGEAMRRALNDAGNRQVEWLSYAKEGHGWREPANKIDFWNRVAAFLAKQLA